MCVCVCMCARVCVCVRWGVCVCVCVYSFSTDPGGQEETDLTRRIITEESGMMVGVVMATIP